VESLKQHLSEHERSIWIPEAMDRISHLAPSATYITPPEHTVLPPSVSYLLFESASSCIDPIPGLTNKDLT
jgi:hypothetical protein